MSSHIGIGWTAKTVGKTGWCGVCMKRKSRHAFYPRRDGLIRRGGIRKPCIACMSRSSRAWQVNNPVLVKRTRARWIDAGGCRRMRLNARGLTETQFAEMLIAQGGLCLVCRCDLGHLKRDGGRIHVDHCHRSGRVRGLLCLQCNVGLGMFRDSPALLIAAVKYLKRMERL